MLLKDHLFPISKKNPYTDGDPSVLKYFLRDVRTVLNIFLKIRSYVFSDVANMPPPKHTHTP